MKPEQQERIIPLDGWWAISVSLVILSHLASYSNIAVRIPGEFGRLVATPILGEIGSLGVIIFFVISGYVITSGFIQEYAATGRIYLIGFYLRRGFRILPPLVLYVIAILGLVRLHFLPHEASGAARALTFTCNFLSCGGWFRAHTWSLSYEEQFYLVIPFIFSVLSRSARLLFIVVPCSLALIMLVLYMLGQYIAYFIGPFLAITVGVSWATNQTAVIAFCRSIPRSLVFASPILLIMAERLSDTRVWPVGAVMVPLIVTFLLARTTFFGGRVARNLSSPWLAHYWRISYSVYLWQQLATFPFPGVGLFFYAGSVVKCLGWAFLSYKWIERPLITFARSMCSGGDAGFQADAA